MPSQDIDTDAIRPFRVEIPEETVAALGQRLDRVRWTPGLPGTGWDYGVPLEHVRALTDYWRTGYDWRKWEARLNEHPQHLTTIDGQSIHFLHVRSPEPDAVPLVLSHGWPSTVVEFLDVIGPLTDPRTHLGTPGPAFHLVIPSLPGFGFSGPTTEPGWHTGRIASAWAELMRRLGYRRYGAAGNDCGADVTVDLARLHPQAVIGAHVTQLWSLPRGDAGELVGLSEADQAGYDAWRWFRDALGAYQDLHGQQPQTLAHALADSPVGLLAWFCQIYRDEVDDDFILTNVMLTHLTNTAGSSTRIYYENARRERPTRPTTVPIGLAQFGDDFISMRRFAERDHHNIVSWNAYDRPGHFAARQSPDLLVADLRAFFGALG